MSLATINGARQASCIMPGISYDSCSQDSVAPQAVLILMFRGYGCSDLATAEWLAAERRRNELTRQQQAEMNYSAARSRLASLARSERD